jgi:hypothetical protein
MNSTNSHYQHPRRYFVIATLLLALISYRAEADPTFTNVAEELGFTQIQRDSEIVSNYTSQLSGGAAVGDYDGDGLDDLYVTIISGPDVLYRNLGDGTFEDVTAEANLFIDLRTNGAGWADVDNDGDLDLYLMGHHTFRNYLFINQGNGTFQEEAAIRGAEISTDVKHTGFSVSFGDYNRDGWIDVHTSEWRTVPLNESHSRLLRNRGSAQPGFFGDVTDEAGVWPTIDNRRFATAFADIDQDNWQDIPIASDFGSSELWWNNGDETFTQGWSEEAGLVQSSSDMGSTLGDYDNDGDLDWFITNINVNRLYRNDGARQFTDVSEDMGIQQGGWGWGAALLDFDNDGDLDIAMTNGLSTRTERNYLWRNDGPHQPMVDISAETGIDEKTSSKGLLVFDYDLDGDLDVFITNNGERPSLFRNDGGNRNHWLRFRFNGRHTNTEGLGVKIWLRSFPNGLLQYREMGVSTHYLTQSERVAHFGLGPVIPENIQVTFETLNGFTHTIEVSSIDTTLVMDASDFDADGLANQEEGFEDVDNDGLANYLDKDSDNDGAWDEVEAMHNGNPLDPGVHPEPSNIPGDVNYDQVTNAVDVQLVINRVLGQDTGYRADLNGDGTEDAVDVQLGVNATLGVS